MICSKFVDAFVDSFLSQQNDLGFSIDSEEAVKKRLAMHLIIIIIFIISIFLQTVAHSAELVFKGPSIYKVKAKILQKLHIFKKPKLKVYITRYAKQLFTNKT